MSRISRNRPFRMRGWSSTCGFHKKSRWMHTLVTFPFCIFLFRAYLCAHVRVYGKKEQLNKLFFAATFAWLQGTLRLAPDIARRFDGFLALDELVAAYFLFLLRIINGRKLKTKNVEIATVVTWQTNRDNSCSRLLEYCIEYGESGISFYKEINVIKSNLEQTSANGSERETIERLASMSANGASLFRYFATSQRAIPSAKK